VVRLLKPLPLLGALLLAGLGAALRWAINPYVSGVPFITFFPAVMLSAYLWGTRFGFVTAAASAVLAWYFFVPPKGSFAVTDVRDGITLVLLTLISLAIAFVIGGFRKLVTRERSAIEAVKEREARFRLVADTSPALIWMSDDKAEIIFANARFRNFFGVESDEMLGTGWRSIVHPDDVDSFHAAFLAAFEKREPVHLEVRVLHPEKGIRWLSCDGTPRFSGETFEGYVGVNIDITDAKLADIERQQREEMLRSVVEQMPIGVTIAQVPGGEVLVYNRKAEELLGHPVLAADVETYGAYGGLDAEGAPLPPDRYPTARAVLHGETVVDEEMSYRRGDGSLTTLSVSATRIAARDGQSPLAVCTFSDISQRKRHEDHQRLLIDELNHRVKNTLAIVQSIAHQTLRSNDVPAPVRRAFEGRLLALAGAHDVLTQKMWEPTSLGGLFSNAIASLGLDAARVILVGPRVLVPPKTAVSLAMAFHELATNALKYGSLSVPEGRVEVSWGQEDERLRLQWQESGGPPVTPPARSGFGTRLIERSLAAELEGSARLDYRPEGLVCTIEARVEG
jgi:PAS domain S-box-containing protein